MGIFDRLKPAAGPEKGQPEIRRPSGIDEKGHQSIAAGATSAETEQHTTDVRTVGVLASDDSDNEDELVHKDMQRGVQKSEAMAQVWPRWALYFTYAWVWVIYFIDALEGPVGWTLAPYVTSEFQLHSLTALTSTISILVSGLFKLPLAKIIDIWGRPEGLALMVLLMTIGSIMTAATNNVETYAAAQVFADTGGTCRNYVLSVLLTDTSQLKNRGLIFAYIASPYLITTFTSGYFADAMLNGPGWRWAFGIFAILHPVLNLPLIAILLFYQNKAINMGLVPIHKSGRSLWQSVKYYLVEFDVFGIFLLCAGLALFLLGFSLTAYQGPPGDLDAQWTAPQTLAMIIIGFFTIVAFIVWEAKLAPVTFLPYHLLRDRTILGAFFLAGICFVEFYLWNSYFTSFLQVVPGLNLVQVGYITGIYSVGSCFWSFIVGFVIRYTGDYKYQTLFFGVPMTLLGVALMIVFRQPDVNVGYIVMCQIFIAFGGGANVIGQQVAALAAVTHQYVAVVLAILSVATAVGGAIGTTVSTAIWTNTFEPYLLANLPPETVSNATVIYGDINTQLLYPEGSPTRDVIQDGYGNAQRYMLIAATAVTCLGFPSVAVWRNIDTRKRKQVKGRVF